MGAVDGGLTEPGTSAALGIDPGQVRARLAELRGRVAASGGDPARTSIVAVTKGFGPDAVAAALAAGLEEVGENYAQELVAKAAGLGPGPAPRWQFIGHLQRNKVRVLAAHVHRFQSVDRGELVDELCRRAPGARVLVQVNTTDEPQKAGCAPGEVAPLVERARAGGLVVEGLMTVGPTAPGAPAGPAFATLRRLVDAEGLEICSMGMTDDLEEAVREGSTMLRIGRALFGARPASAASRPSGGERTGPSRGAPAE